MEHNDLDRYLMSSGHAKFVTLDEYVLLVLADEIEMAWDRPVPMSENKWVFIKDDK